MGILKKVLVAAACAVAFVILPSVSAFAGGGGGGYMYCYAGLTTVDIVFIVGLIVLPGVVTAALWARWCMRQLDNQSALGVFAVALIAIILSVAISITVIVRTAGPYEAELECVRGWTILLAALLSAVISFVVPMLVAERCGVKVFHDEDDRN